MPHPLATVESAPEGGIVMIPSPPRKFKAAQQKKSTCPKEDYILITYTCLHSDIIALHRNAESNFEYMEYVGLHDLQKFKPLSHIAVPGSCGFEKCETIPTSNWELKTSNALTEIKSYLECFRNSYLSLAEMWFRTGSIARARLANDAECRLAREQFDIVEKNWEDDRFFWTYRRLQSCIEDLSQTSTPNSDKINHARSLIPFMETQIQGLVAGVKKVREDYVVACKERDKPVYFRTGRVNRKGRRNKRENKNTLGIQLMEKAMAKRFWKRVEGFGEECDGQIMFRYKETGTKFCIYRGD